MKTILRIAALLVVAASGASVRAQISAITFTADGSGGYYDQEVTVGFIFSLSATTTVVSLGVWAPAPGNELLSSHDVGIFRDNGTATGTLLASTTVLAGTGGILQDGFRYNNISPLILPAGTYVIGAHYDRSLLIDYFGSYVENLISAPGVTFISDRVSPGGALTLTFPLNDDPGFEDGFFGPNFLIASGVTPVPEPATYGLMGAVALAGVVALKRRRRSAPVATATN